MRLVREVMHYMKTHKRWWLLPILLIFALFGVLLAVAQFAPIVSPFIYTLF